MDFPDFNTIECTVQTDGITVCAFNRPEVRNALSLEMVTDIHTMLELLIGSGNTRVLVFVGNGNTFISGADLA